MEEEIEFELDRKIYSITYLITDNQIDVYHEGEHIGSTQVNGINPKSVSRTFLVSYLKGKN